LRSVWLHKIIIWISIEISHKPTEKAVIQGTYGVTGLSLSVPQNFDANPQINRIVKIRGFIETDVMITIRLAYALNLTMNS
jgi:hypothetical protein